jgi:excisionase family DNA binding protein
MIDPVLLTVAECAAALSVSRARAYELVAAGTIPVVRIGRTMRVPTKALEEWVAGMLERQSGEANEGLLK